MVAIRNQNCNCNRADSSLDPTALELIDSVFGEYLTPQEAPLELTAALVHHSPAASVNVRVERLVAWSEERRVPDGRYSSWQIACAGLATLAVLVMTYSQMLTRVHVATEWLVR